VPGVGGVFEITVDGRLAFSKKQTGRFPTDEEIDALGAGSCERRAISRPAVARPDAISKMPTEMVARRCSPRGFRTPPQRFPEIRAAAI